MYGFLFFVFLYFFRPAGRSAMYIHTYGRPAMYIYTRPAGQPAMYIHTAGRPCIAEPVAGPVLGPTYLPTYLPTYPRQARFQDFGYAHNAFYPGGAAGGLGARGYPRGARAPGARPGGTPPGKKSRGRRGALSGIHNLIYYVIRCHIFFLLIFYGGRSEATLSWMLAKRSFCLAKSSFCM